MNLVILGPQGSGKGTQVELLAKKFNLTVFSAGNILRNSTNSVITDAMTSGNLVPDQYLRQIVEEFLQQNTTATGFIFDGYPRTIAQYAQLKSLLPKIDAVINIEISEAETIRRLSARRTCIKCGEIYNLLTKPPKGSVCDVCGGELVQREDDKPEAIKRRLQIYREQTHPVFTQAVEEGVGIEVNGAQPIEKVFQDIISDLEK